MEYTEVREALIEVEGRQTKVDGLVMVINDTVCIPVTRRSLSIIHLLFSRKNLFPQTTIAVASGTIAIVAIVESDGIIIQVINEVEAAMGAESDDDY